MNTHICYLLISQLPLTTFTTLPTQKSVKPAKHNPQQEKIRQMLTVAIKHVSELPTKSRQYYTHLAKENPDLEEAKQLLKLLSDESQKQCSPKPLPDSC